MIFCASLEFVERKRTLVADIFILLPLCITPAVLCSFWTKVVFLEHIKPVKEVLKLSEAGVSLKPGILTWAISEVPESRLGCVSVSECVHTHRERRQKLHQDSSKNTAASAAEAVAPTEPRQCP